MRLHVTAAQTSDRYAVVVDGPNMSGVAALCGEPPVEATVDVEIDVADEVSWGDVVRDSDTIDACVQSAQGSDQLVVVGSTIVIVTRRASVFPTGI